MKTRQITIVAGILVIVGSVFLMNFLTSQKEKPEREKNQKQRRAVSTLNVDNSTVQASVPITGRLQAEERVELYAEVSGTFQKGKKPFKEGIRYRKGETLIRIDDEEARMNLVAQRSNLLNQITKVMPDLKIDYPDSYKKWQDYLDRFDVKGSLPPIPEPANEQVEYFITSRNIYNQYYNIKSQETRLSKYTIEAPFTGVLTKASIDPGTLVRNGQKLGEFIKTGAFELEAAVSEDELPLVSIDDSVYLQADNMRKGWYGRVIRINDKIDPGTQTAKVFVLVEGKSLKEGQYLEGQIESERVAESIQIPRKLIHSDSLVWTVEDSALQQQPIEVVQQAKRTAIIKGLANGAKLLNEPVTNAYEGMPVKPIEQRKN